MANSKVPQKSMYLGCFLSLCNFDTLQNCTLEHPDLDKNQCKPPNATLQPCFQSLYTEHGLWRLKKWHFPNHRKMDGQFVNHGTQKGQTVMLLPLGAHSKCTYNPDTWYPLSAGGTCRGNLTKWQTKCPYADLSEDSVLQNAILEKSTNSTPKLQF